MHLQLDAILLVILLFSSLFNDNITFGFSLFGVIRVRRSNKISIRFIPEITLEDASHSPRDESYRKWAKDYNHQKSILMRMPQMEEGAVTFEIDGAFYNPKMKLNREICVAMAAALDLGEYLDALSASGIRGMRVAREAGVRRVTLNDVSPRAHELIMKNLGRNGLECEATCRNANALMHERRFQAVDLDPFGSPSPFLAAASRSALSYLFVTATDTAPLCGAHLNSGIRKYLARPLRTDYHREMGARILLGLSARELARLDKGMEPLLTHVTDHYVRVYLRVRKGAKAADDCLSGMGYVEHCPSCGCFVTRKGPEPEGNCSHCQARTILAGPLWLGKIQAKETILTAMQRLDEGCRARRLLEICAAEEDVPMYYDHHSICERLNITPGRIDDVVQRLRDRGHRASRTHFCGLGIKTDAPLVQVEEASKARDP
ncbi:MAG: tRNA (guanine(26)-N(2))-dimethyltransferase [Methanosaeta sp. PtaU1.Bin060]|nr:MAG: tRNA (guanine(26)-N(2))-dimethyltransferase [Methanosaeta sp. PtaU1.Bin060]